MRVTRHLITSELLGEDVEVLQTGTAATADSVVWLLHGRAAASQEVAAVLGRLDAPRCVVLAPVGPWMGGSHWWVDSASTTGCLVESAVAGEVLPRAERLAAVRPRHRIVAGWSMGGAAALRWALTGRGAAASAVLVAPASYPGQPPLGSSARTSGAFGVGGRRFVARRYLKTMCHRRLLPDRDTTAPLRVSIVVGINEAPQQFADGWHSLREDASALHDALVASPGCSSSLSLVDAGHDEDLWPVALTLGLASVRSVLPGDHRVVG